MWQAEALSVYNFKKQKRTAKWICILLDGTHSNDSKIAWASSVMLFPLREQRVEEIAVGKLGITQH
jgi:hypothetical protein